jgi:hypothetical protein
VGQNQIVVRISAKFEAASVGGISLRHLWCICYLVPLIFGWSTGDSEFRQPVRPSSIIVTIPPVALSRITTRSDGQRFLMKVAASRKPPPSGHDGCARCR